MSLMQEKFNAKDSFHHKAEPSVKRSKPVVDWPQKLHGSCATFNIHEVHGKALDQQRYLDPKGPERKQGRDGDVDGDATRTRASGKCPHLISALEHNRCKEW